jgi:uracil DNA glycosylase
MPYFWQLIFAMSSISPQIEKSWLNVLQDEFQKPYFADLKQFLLDEIIRKKDNLSSTKADVFCV